MFTIGKTKIMERFERPLDTHTHHKSFLLFVFLPSSYRFVSFRQ